MWKECRKHDKALAGMMAKQRKRAEKKVQRRRESEENSYKDICIFTQPAHKSNTPKPALYVINHWI